MHNVTLLRNCNRVNFAPIGIFYPLSTTVVDRKLAPVSCISGSGSEERGIDDAFAIGTSGEDAQRRAIRVREGE
jgi:hypothetical protein